MNSLQLRRRHGPSRALFGALLAALGVAIFASSNARADALALYDFQNGRASSDTDPHSAASNIIINLVTFGQIIDSFGNPAPSFVGPTFYSNLGDARRNSQVLTFSLSLQSGYSFSLSSVSFDLAANANGQVQVSQAFVYTDRDGQTTPVAVGAATDPSSDNAPSPFSPSFSTDLSSDPLYQNVTGPINFSLYVFGSNPSGLIFLDNIRVEGSTALVPEPSTWALLLGGAGLLAFIPPRRRSVPIL